MEALPLSDVTCDFVRANGLHLRCWRLGTSGRPLVLLHGFSSSAWRTWKVVAPILAMRYQTYWFDMRGHGESDKPASGYAPSDYAADARALCAVLGLEKPLLVGHSLGARTILTLAAETPHIPGALVAVDPSLKRAGGEPAQRTRFFDVLDLKRLPPAAYQERVREMERTMADDDFADQLIGRAQVSLTALVETMKASQGVDMLAPLAGQVTRGTDILPSLAHIPCPTLLVAGSEKSGVPIPSGLPDDVLAEGIARLPNGRGHTVQGVGHNVPQEKPHELAAAMLEFLATVA